MILVRNEASLLGEVMALDQRGGGAKKGVKPGRSIGVCESVCDLLIQLN